MLCSLFENGKIFEKKAVFLKALEVLEVFHGYAILKVGLKSPLKGDRGSPPRIMAEEANLGKLKGFCRI